MQSFIYYSIKMTTANNSTLELLDQSPQQERKEKRKQFIKKSIIRLLKQLQNLAYWLLNQLFPTNCVKVKFIYPDGRPARYIGGISHTYNQKKYRTKNNGRIRIYLKRKINRNRSSRKRKIYYPLLTSIYIHQIRATKKLSPSHRTYTIVISRNPYSETVKPVNPYKIKKKKSLIKRYWKMIC